MAIDAIKIRSLHEIDQNMEIQLPRFKRKSPMESLLTDKRSSFEKSKVLGSEIYLFKCFSQRPIQLCKMAMQTN